MQESPLIQSLVDLFEAAVGMEEREELSPIIQALENVLNNEGALEELAEMLEHLPIYSNPLGATTILLTYAASLPNSGCEGIDLVRETALVNKASKAALLKPSWDTFSKARPIIIKSPNGVFM